MQKEYSSQRQAGGFTMAELLVALGVAAIILTLIVTIFSRMSTSYTSQNAAADLQQGMRTALDIVTRDIRMAGYDKTESGNFGFKSIQAFHVRFTADFKENGTVDVSDEEIISYLWSADHRMQRRLYENTSAQDTQTMLGGEDGIDVITFAFRYLDRNNSQTSQAAEVRAVEIVLTAEIPAGKAGMLRKSYTTRVECRNMGN